MNKVAVILSGCGYLDGSEIHESVFTLLALKRNGLNYQCFAPNRTQYDVINHTKGQETAEVRNILEESARIARGDVIALNKLNPNEYSALILPGGYGVIKNLSSFVVDGEHFSVQEDIQSIIEQFYNDKKPIGALCISPIILAKLFPESNLSLTVGSQDNCENVLTPLGVNGSILSSTEICVDELNNITSTPAYMNNEPIENIATGIEKLVANIATKIKHIEQAA